MADLSKFSDAELERVAKLASISDADLETLAKGKQGPNPLTDALHSVPGGLAKGIAATGGLPSSALNFLSNQAGRLVGRPQTPDNSPQAATFMGLPTIGQLNDTLSMPTGGYYEPKTQTGKYTETAASFVPGAFGGEASILERALARVAAPLVGSETAGHYAKGTNLEGLARVAGALLGGAGAVGAAAAARGGARALVSKLGESIPPEDAALVSQYEGMGGHLRPGQYSQSNFMRQGDATLADTPWPRASGFKADSPTAVLPAQQADEFNRFLSRSFGEDAPRITEEVVQSARKRIGDVYETVLPNNVIKDTPEIRAALDSVESDIAKAAPAMEPKDLTRISATVNRIRSQLTEEGIPGKLYQEYRKRGGLLDELTASTSSALQGAAKSIRGALDDAFIAQAKPEDAAALLKAKEQYRNLETLAPLAAKAPTGSVNPGAVLGAVNKEFGSPGKAGDLGTLARVGAAFLKAQPSSGTAERSVWRSLINKPFSEGLPAVGNAAVSLPVSAFASRALNKMINSPEMRARLLAQLQQPGSTQLPPGANSAALAKALQP